MNAGFKGVTSLTEMMFFPVFFCEILVVFFVIIFSLTKRSFGDYLF